MSTIDDLTNQEGNVLALSRRVGEMPKSPKNSISVSVQLRVTTTEYSKN